MTLIKMDGLGPEQRKRNEGDLNCNKPYPEFYWQKAGGDMYRDGMDKAFPEYKHKDGRKFKKNYGKI